MSQRTKEIDVWVDQTGEVWKHEPTGLDGMKPFTKAKLVMPAEPEKLEFREFEFCLTPDKHDIKTLRAVFLHTEFESAMKLVGRKWRVTCVEILEDV